MGHRKDRVGEPALLADLVEQARAHRTTEQRRVDPEGDALAGVAGVNLGLVEHPQVRLVAVALLDQGDRLEGSRCLGLRRLGQRREPAEILINCAVCRHVLQVANDEGAAKLP